MWTDEVKIEIFGHNNQKYFWTEEGAEFIEKNTSPIVKHRVGLMLGPVLQPVAHGTFHW